MVPNYFSFMVYSALPPTDVSTAKPGAHSFPFTIFDAPFFRSMRLTPGRYMYLEYRDSFGNRVVGNEDVAVTCEALQYYKPEDVPWEISICIGFRLWCDKIEEVSDDEIKCYDKNLRHDLD